MSNLSYGGFVYLIECCGVYKIGCTQDLEKRLNGHQTALPGNVVLVASFPSVNHRADEARIHDLLVKYRVKGKKEWFSIPKSWLKRKDEWFYSQVEAKTQEQKEDEEYSQYIRFCSVVLAMPSLAQKIAKMNDDDFKVLVEVARRDYAIYEMLVEDGEPPISGLCRTKQDTTLPTGND